MENNRKIVMTTAIIAATAILTISIVSLNTNQNAYAITPLIMEDMGQTLMAYPQLDLVE